MSRREGTVPAWKSHRDVTVPMVMSKRPPLAAQYPSARRVRSAVSGATGTGSGEAAWAREMSESGRVRDSLRSKYRHRSRQAASAPSSSAATAESAGSAPSGA